MNKQQAYVVHAAKIVDGTGRPPIVNASILVSEGKISYIGPREGVPLPEDVHVIEAPDVTVLPGLIDGHTAFAGSWQSVKILRGYLQYGVTTVASFHANREGIPGVPMREAIEQGFLRGCSQYLAGHVVNCTHGHNRGRTADGPWEVRKAVREMIEEGADFIKTAASGGFWRTDEATSSPNYTQEELNALVDEAHSWGKKVGVHVHTQPGLDRAIEAGVDLIYHGCFIDEAALQKMAGRGTWYLPTLKVTCQRNIDAWIDRPWMRQEMEAATEVHRRGVTRAIELGVRVGLGSDGPGTHYTWLYGEASVFEIAELVRCGMTPLQAISTATLQTATAYGINQRVGSLEVGKQADILCVKGDPLEHIDQLQEQERVALVFLKGKVEYASPEFREYYTIRDEDEYLQPGSGVVQ